MQWGMLKDVPHCIFNKAVSHIFYLQKQKVLVSFKNCKS